MVCDNGVNGVCEMPLNSAFLLLRGMVFLPTALLMAVQSVVANEDIAGQHYGVG